MPIMSNLHLLQPGWVTVGKGVHDLPDRDAKGAEPVQDRSGEPTHGSKLRRDVEGVQVNASTRNQNKKRRKRKKKRVPPMLQQETKIYLDQCHLVWPNQIDRFKYLFKNCQKEIENFLF